MKQLMKKTGLYFALCALAVGFAGMQTALAQSGESAVVSEARSVDGDITAVSVQGPIDLKLKQGATPALTLRAERRVLPDVTTAREGNTLRIFARGRFSTRQAVVAELTLPALQAVQMLGSGNADIAGFSGASLKLGMMGSGDVRCDAQYQVLRAELHGSGDLKFNNAGGERVELSVFGSGNIVGMGKAKLLTAKIMGSGSIDAKQLQTETTTISIFGTGDAHVNAANSVAVSSRGTGDVVVYGKPAQRAVSISGTGSVRWQQ